MTSKLTRERLQEIAEDGFLKHGESKELARMALAAMDSEPVAYISKSDFDAGYPHILARRDFNKACTMPVYAAQPTPVVPKSISVREAISALESEDAVTTIGQAYKMGWNACRAAMLAAAPQSPGSEPATVPGKWIPVSERMPESNGMYFGWDGKRVLEVYCFFGGFSANQFIHGEITHWMPLPASPQEVR
ncbi:TPA: DUF551 domain-containing protein [Klebsiella pneumoniae subsp. pneumoniae]|uniref:DUF551 domain-containing protein n=1 Tax=Klebsiella pneumoniae TaxID=573 RepID=UPI0007CBF81D|nr:DUF551 domain-containing protein [Klebsiella pneumoniae]HDS6159918.1 DUF551 domain-containing protein [Klebsiella pneumoniae subsp. pneumoniae]HDT5741947.1 DUF551 domain-containing protein [Klebsiella quasipneumoniae subsp. similipneumoniae]SAX34506.1 Eaa1 [Klebsiella pneumoniae]HBR4810021.1 DUF551 domain-containing protein [Klebsiella pneumoniae]HDE1928783.1 DUF551 domain-containing protein [Klebsiella pneumoniae]